ncbi:MAG: hypothetical protein ACI4RT_09435 [Candidatus Spyradenecus sp.]
MLHPIMLSALIPPQFRKQWLYRNVKLYAPTIGHALLIEKLCPDGIRSPEEHAMAAIILRHGYATSAHLICNGKTTNADHDAAPKDEAERAELLNYIERAWRTPARFDEPAHGLAKPAPHPAAKEFASTAALRLALRVASLPGIHHIIPCDLLDLPIADALALLIADDELHGAHYLSADTEARLTR